MRGGGGARSGAARKQGDAVPIATLSLSPPPASLSLAAFRLSTAAFMGTLMGGLYYQSGVEKGLNYYGLFLNTIMLLSVRGAAAGKPLT